ncbi:unnamed protein product [Leuciscus chuanchicus]
MGCGHGDSRAGVDSELTPLTSSVCKPASEEDCEKLFIACFAVKDSKLTPLTSSVCKPAFEEDCEKLFIGYFAVKDSKLTPLTSSVCKPAFEEDCEKLFIGYFAVKDSSYHLVCATLLQEDRFDEYKDTFPDDALSSTIRAYPMLSGSKLKTELSLIYSKQEFSACRGAVDLFQLFMENNLEEVFSETVTLLKVIITTPMTTAEAESEGCV